MEFLIIFETFEGQTGKIVKRVERQLKDAGHGVQLFDTSDKLAPLSFEGVDKVVLAAPVHERRHPPNFEVTVSSNLAELGALPTLLISVSLKAAFPESMGEANDYLVEMKLRTGFNPDVELLVAGAVRMGSYDYFESQIVQYVALDGQSVELVNGEREFTDSDQLQTDIAAFIG